MRNLQSPPPAYVSTKAGSPALLAQSPSFLRRLWRERRARRYASPRF